jgi:hypothetical protein
MGIRSRGLERRSAALDRRGGDARWDPAAASVVLGGDCDQQVKYSDESFPFPRCFFMHSRLTVRVRFDYVDCLGWSCDQQL